MSSYRNKFFLVGLDYVSKWVEEIPLHQNDGYSIIHFLKKSIFTRFGTPRAIISDGRSHFLNQMFISFLSEYGVKHKVKTPYHPQTNGQVKISNREIKNILAKTVNASKII